MPKMSTQRVQRAHEFHRPRVIPLPPNDAHGGSHTIRHEQFLTMLDGFRLSGGTALGHDLAPLLSSCAGLSIGGLARGIVEGEVVHFEWQHETWLPLFQFSGPDMALLAGVRQVLKEFSGVLDPWETAQWFACPSEDLGGRTPADEVALRPDSVLHSARCERYVVDA